MKTAAAYQAEINEILGIQVEEGETPAWDFDSVNGSEGVLEDTDAVLAQLEVVRAGITNDTKAIHDTYREKMDNAASTRSAAMSMLGRKQKAGQLKADAKRLLRTRRNEELAPFNEIKTRLDRLISRMEEQAVIAQKLLAEEPGKAGPAPSLSPASPRITLANFYFDSPPEGSYMNLERMRFPVAAPLEPNEIIFNQEKPAPPLLKETGVKGLFSPAYRQQIEEENQRLQELYQSKLQAWVDASQAAEKNQAEAQAAFLDDLAAWREKQREYEAAETARIQQLEDARLKDNATMRSLLGRQLDALHWPAELEMEFATEYWIEDGGLKVRLEVRLPEQGQGDGALNDLSQDSYARVIYGTGLRLVGHTFFALPACQQVIINGYTGQPGHHEKIYLYSSKVARDSYKRAGIEDIEHLDPAGCFDRFETRHLFQDGDNSVPVEPFT